MKIVASFSIDPDDGQPACEEIGGLKHYSIALKVIDPPEGARRVRYKLHPTYRRPVREVTPRIPDFEEPITSFGDFDVVAEVDAGGNSTEVTIPLSKALEDGHREGMTEAIRDAIEQVRLR